MKGRLVPLLVLVTLVAGAAWAVTRLEIETDITRFLPEGEDPRVSRVAGEVVRSELNRTITVTLEAPDEDTAAAASRAMGERLANHRDVDWVRTGPDPSLQQTFYEVYFPRRLGFAQDVSADSASLSERAEYLKTQLSLPTSPFTREIAASDPLLLFPAHLDRLAGDLRGTLRVHDGAFVTEDGRYGVVILASRATAFDADAARRLLGAIDAAFVEVDRELGGVLALEMSGVHRFAIRGEETTKADINRVSIVGTLGVLVFLFVIFRRPRYLILGNVPLIAGVASALLATTLVFERIHGLTLAFGATLIGVAIDYVAHYLNHHVLAPDPDGPAATMRRIWPGLRLGGVTTIAGIAGLAGTGYPAIQEMAFFTSVGVLGALLATRFIVPPFMPTDPTPTGIHRALAAGVSAALERVAAHRRALYAIPIAVLLLVAGGLTQVRFLDDVRVLNSLDPVLLAEDDRVRERVARVDAGRFVVAFGDDIEAALAANDRVNAVLAEAIADGEVGRQRSVATLLPSAETQRARRDALVAGDFVPRTLAALEGEGFVTASFAPFAESVEEPYAPLVPGDLEGTPLASMVAPFLLDAEGDAAVLTFVHGVRDPAALTDRLAVVDGALFFDQPAYMADSYRRFRTSVQVLLGVGLIFVLLLIFLRYRDLRRTLAAYLPAVGAGAATLGAISLLGFPLTLIHVVTLLLVLSMGVDYGVFMVESEHHDEGPTPTVVSLLIACASTVLSFGALAMSEQPALRAMGLTTAIGVALSLLFAPAAWLVIRRKDVH
jgi:predicted exporter